MQGSAQAFCIFIFIHPSAVQIKHARVYFQFSCVLSPGPLGKTRHAVCFHAVCMSFPAALVRGLKSHPCSLNRERDDRRGSSESLQIGRPGEAGDLHPAPSASIHISILAKVRHRPAGSSSIAFSEQEGRKRGGRKGLQLCVCVCVDLRLTLMNEVSSPLFSGHQTLLLHGRRSSGATTWPVCVLLWVFLARFATEQPNGC